MREEKREERREKRETRREVGKREDNSTENRRGMRKKVNMDMCLSSSRSKKRTSPACEKREEINEKRSG